MADRAFLERLSRQLADEGKLIEAGWIALRVTTGLESAPKRQLEDMRTAYYAGAQHLFASIMAVMDEDREPTDDDMRRMDLINAELEAWTRAMKGTKPDA